MLGCWWFVGALAHSRADGNGLHRDVGAGVCST